MPAIINFKEAVRYGQEEDLQSKFKRGCKW